MSRAWAKITGAGALAASALVLLANRDEKEQSAPAPVATTAASTPAQDELLLVQVVFR